MNYKLWNLDDWINGGGGVVFLSSSGQGMEKRDGYNADSKSENIDDLLNVIDAAYTVAGDEIAKNTWELWQQIVESRSISTNVIEKIKEIIPKNESQSPKGKSVWKCNADGCNGKIIDSSEAPVHSKVVNEFIDAGVIKN